jgi:hypothetical protein
MDDVQELNNFINIPLSHTLRSHRMRFLDSLVHVKIGNL